MCLLGSTAPIYVSFHVLSVVIKIYVLVWALGTADRQLSCQQSTSCQRQMLNVRRCPGQWQALKLHLGPQRITKQDVKIEHFQKYKN